MIRQIVASVFLVGGLLPVGGRASSLQPNQNAPFVLDDERLALLKSTLPYVVELTKPSFSGSGVIVYWTKENQALVLGAGHGIKPVHTDATVISLDGVSRTRPGVEHILGSNFYQARTSWASTEMPEKIGWIDFPIFHPPYEMKSEKPEIPRAKDYGFHIMTGTNLVAPPEGHTISNALSKGFDPGRILPPLKFANPKGDEEVLMLGRTHYFQKVPDMDATILTDKNSFSFGRVMSVDEAVAFAEEFGFDFDPLTNLIVDGEADHGFSGGPIFNKKGELIGIISNALKPYARFVRNRHDRSQNSTVATIGVRIDHIISSMKMETLKGSKPYLQPFLDQKFESLNSDCSPFFQEFLHKAKKK